MAGPLRPLRGGGGVKSPAIKRRTFFIAVSRTEEATKTNKI